MHELSIANSVRAGMRIIESFAKTGLGLLEWIEYLEGKRSRSRR